jgi:hypothetical protein
MATASGSAVMILVLIVLYKFFQPIPQEVMDRINTECPKNHELCIEDYSTSPYDTLSWMNLVRVAWISKGAQKAMCKICELQTRLRHFEFVISKLDNYTQECTRRLVKYVRKEWNELHSSSEEAYPTLDFSEELQLNALEPDGDDEFDESLSFEDSLTGRATTSKSEMSPTINAKDVRNKN